MFMLIDYRHRPSDDDVLMYEFLKFYNLKVKLVATKYDKVKKSARDKQDKIIREALNLEEEEEFITFSTVTKKGREEVYGLIESLL